MSKDIKRYCRMLDLNLSEELIKEYRFRHSKEGVWPEIVKGIKEVGILEMELWLLGNRAVMILETPADLDLDAAFDRLATLPRQQEWEDYMSVFQNAKKGATSSEKWQPMEQIFHLYDF